MSKGDENDKNNKTRSSSHTGELDIVYWVALGVSNLKAFSEPIRVDRPDASRSVGYLQLALPDVMMNCLRTWQGV